MENEKRYAVAVDGPSGAGKSSLARRAAKELSFIYVDTGAIYRTVGLAALRRGGEAEDVLRLLPALRVTMDYGADGLQRMYLDGEDVTEQIRLPEVSMLASQVSALPEVRSFLLDMQRSMAEKHSVIMDGRDIGTVVLPRADVKIFLTASVEDRARRRYRELRDRGVAKDFEQLLQEIQQRDYNDEHRAAAPLRPAEDAVLLDTTGNTFAQSLEQILDIIRGRLEP